MVTATNLPLPQLLARLDGERLRAYREHLDFYRGLQWPGPNRRRERRLTFNYARAFIDKITAYLVNGASVVAEPADASPSAEDAARRVQQALRRAHDDNDLEQLDFETEIDCAVLGDGSYKVTWDQEVSRVRITAPDVQGLFAWWAGDDPSRIWRVASRYTLTDEELALLHPKVSFKPRASGHTVVELWTEASFQFWADDALAEERPNPYGFIPFVIFPNIREPKQFWGTSDLAAISEPAQELNRALSQLSAILELSGNPVAVLENVERAEDIAVQPGAVWELPEKARAYLLDLLQGGGVKLHTDYIELLYRALHDLSEAPRTAFGDNVRSLSGVALEMELHPLLHKVRRKRLIRAAAYRRRAEMVLRLTERMTGERFPGAGLHVLWGPVLPQDQSRLARDEKLLVEAGLHSRRTAMQLLGVPDVERELREVELKALPKPG